MTFTETMRLHHLRPECESCRERRGTKCGRYIRPDAITTTQQDTDGVCRAWVEGEQPKPRRCRRTATVKPHLHRSPQPGVICAICGGPKTGGLPSYCTACHREYASERRKRNLAAGLTSKGTPRLGRGWRAKR